MKPRNLVYYFREALKSLRRNRLLSLATITTVAICILILGLSVLATLNASNLVNRLEADVEIIAFLDQDLSKYEISDVRNELISMSGVKSVEFISRDEALQNLQKNFGQKEYNLKETLGKNPLPHSFRIKGEDPRQTAGIARKVTAVEGIYKVNYGRGMVERLFSVTRWVRIISIAFIVALFFGAIFLIATTIRLAIFARRKEVYLMKLIGSTDWFIRWPFFIEGVFLGAMGALLAIAVLAGSYGSLVGHFETVFFLPLVNNPAILGRVYLSLLAGGAVLGVLGTWISLNRFLDV